MKRKWARLGLFVVYGLVIGFQPGCSQAPAPEPTKARNIVLFIGDGLGTTQMALGLHYARVVENRELAMERLMKEGMTGYALPVTFDSIVVDSAASATQMATGVAVRSETLGIDPDGYDLETVLELADGRGMATGLVSNMRLTHATPAAFTAHQISRYVPEPDIANDLLGDHEIEVLLGGGARAFVRKGNRVSEELPGVPSELDGGSGRKDDRSLVEEARERGYAVVSDLGSLEESAEEATRLLGLFSATHLPYELDRKAEGLDQVPRLKDLTGAALDVLARNERGFFLMIEGGRIDYAGHDNDAGTMLSEILEFDEALEVALHFQASHPDTLVVVTADHGTGGFSHTYSRRSKPKEIALASGAKYRARWFYPGKEKLEILARQTASFERILARSDRDPDRLMEEVTRATGLTLTREEAIDVLGPHKDSRPEPEDFRHFYTDPENVPQCLLGRELARQTSVVWSTGGHTSDPVLTFGKGPGADKLRGLYPNTHVYEVMKAALPPTSYAP